MAWDFSPKPWITLAVSTTVSVSLAIFSAVSWAVFLPFWARSLVWDTALLVESALVTTCFKVIEDFSIDSEVSATLSAWVAEPLATCWMALDTSWVEAFISSVDEANCWAEVATLSAKLLTWPKASCRESISLLKTSANWPISSWELTATFSAVKSPWETFSAMPITLSKGVTIWLMMNKHKAKMITITTPANIIIPRVLLFYSLGPFLFIVLIPLYGHSHYLVNAYTMLFISGIENALYQGPGLVPFAALNQGDEFSEEDLMEFNGRIKRHNYNGVPEFLITGGAAEFFIKPVVMAGIIFPFNDLAFSIRLFIVWGLVSSIS